MTSQPEMITNKYTEALLYAIYSGNGGFLIVMPYGGYAVCEEDFAMEVLGKNEILKRDTSGRWFDIPLRFNEDMTFFNLLSNVNCLDIEKSLELGSFNEQTKILLNERKNFVSRVRQSVYEAINSRYTYILDFIKSDLENNNKTIEDSIKSNKMLEEYEIENEKMNFQFIASYFMSSMDNIINQNIKFKINQHIKENGIEIDTLEKYLKEGIEIATEEKSNIEKWIEKYDQKMNNYRNNP